MYFVPLDLLLEPVIRLLREHRERRSYRVLIDNFVDQLSLDDPCGSVDCFQLKLLSGIGHGEGCSSVQDVPTGVTLVPLHDLYVPPRVSIEIVLSISTVVVVVLCILP